MFTAKIQDSTGREIAVEVSEEIFNIFEDDRKELKREHDEYDRHGDYHDVDDYIVV